MRLLLTVSLLTSAGVAFAAPVPKDLKRKAPSVAGTSWRHEDDPYGPVVYKFEEGGGVSYCCDGGNPNLNCGTWTQVGGKVTWHTNNHYADFEVTFVGGKFEGTARNKDNKSWEVTLQSIETPGPLSGKPAK